MKGQHMAGTNRLHAPKIFSEVLFETMKRINTGIEELELYEFRYALENIYPEDGWDSVELDKQEEIEGLIGSRAFYLGIQLRPRAGDRIVLDGNIVRLTRMLFAGLVSGEYPEEWVRAHFYFDIRGFYFLPRTVYFTKEVLAHFGGKPYRRFEQKQRRFERFQEVGYKDFKDANADIDQAFVESVKKLISARGTPMLIMLAGPTAAGKTEITERLLTAFEQTGKKTTTIEVDNFLLDREYRDDKPMGKESTHFELFLRSLEKILRCSPGSSTGQGYKIIIPRYDFVYATSSHDLNGNLKAGCIPLEIEPADIIFMEGNFPFHMEELSGLIGIKAVYLTDDPIRLKRKWKRDVDYRKKYDPAYFRNRFFRTQFLRAEDCYRPLMKVCDIVVDTTGAALWATPEIVEILSRD
jgi:uridine kinase